MSDLEQLIKAGALLVDVREPFEVEMDPVPGAINIPLATLAEQLDRFRTNENFIVFCRSGNRSNMAKKFLLSHGIQNVTDGGSFMNVLQYLK